MKLYYKKLIIQDLLNICSALRVDYGIRANLIYMQEPLDIFYCLVCISFLSNQVTETLFWIPYNLKHVRNLTKKKWA